MPLAQAAYLQMRRASSRQRRASNRNGSARAVAKPPARRRRTAATKAPWATRRLRENEWAERDDERARYARNQWRMALQRWLFDALVKKSLVYSWRCALFIRNDMSNEMRKRIHEQ